MGYDKTYARDGLRSRSGFLKNQTFLYLLFVLNILKFSAAESRYFPLQDDFIQYWGYAERSIPYLFSKVGFFDTRPFAGLLDIFIWSKFWNYLELPLLLISLLHFSSAVLFSKALEKISIPCGNIFSAVYLLFPAGFEAVYWLSASTRIVVGLFFASLTVYMAVQKKINSALFFLINLLSFGFYEQTAAVCFILCLWISIHKKRTDIFVCSISAAAVMGIYYIIMSDVGALAGRAALNIHYSADEILNSMLAALKLFFIGNKIFLPVLFTPFVIILYEKTSGSDIKKLYLGILLFFASLLPHMVSGSAHIPFRCVYPAAVGIALIFEYIAEKINIGRIFLPVFTMLAVSANLYQAMIFSETGRFNMRVCSETILSDNTAYRLDKKTLNTAVPDWYGEYMIEDITKSDWAFTGAVRAWYRNVDLDGNRNIIFSGKAEN